MAFDVSGLGDWVNENSQILISKAILEENTISAVSLMSGVKYKEAIKFLETAPLIQAYACGTPTTSGTTTLTDKDISVVNLMVYEELCPEDLAKKALQLSLRPGLAGSEEIPFEIAYTDLQIKNIGKQISDMLWSTTAASTVKSQGWIYAAENDATVHDRTFTWANSGTSTGFMNEVYGMISALPAEIQNATDLTLFVGPEISRKLQQSFVIGGVANVNFTTYDVSKTGNDTWYFPGTNVLVRPTNGLAGVNSVMLTPASNLIVATDLESEFEAFKLWWSDDDQVVKFLSKFRIGADYYFGDYIVLSNA